MYVRKTTKVSEEVSLVHEYGPGRYGAPGQKRKKKEKETPAAVREQNRKNRAQNIQLMILGNFLQKGHHIVLGYPKGEAPGTYEEAEKNLKRFLEDMQRRCKAAGYQFRYIAATERGKREAVLHHHMVIQDVNENGFNLLPLIEERWKGKRVHSTATYEDDTMGRQLADYIVKSIDKDGLPAGKYHISRNLKKPEVRRELVHGHIEEPEPPKGYQIVPDTYYMGTNPWTGWTYQRYFIRSLEIKKNSRKPEWNRDSLEGRTEKTLSGAVKGIFEKVINGFNQNGNKGFGVVDNSKCSNGVVKKYGGESKKPAIQNGNKAFKAVDNSVDNNDTENRHISEGAKNSRQNGNAVLRIVDKLKPLWARLKNRSDKGR